MLGTALLESRKVSWFLSFVFFFGYVVVWCVGFRISQKHISCFQKDILTGTPSAAGPFWLLRIAVLEPWCFLFDRSTLASHFGISGAPWDAILAPRDHPGRPWEQQDGFEVVNNRIFGDFGMILGPVYVSFWNPK